MNKIDKFDSLCIASTGAAPVSSVLLPGAGGDRKYFRLTMPGGTSPGQLLGVVSDNLVDAAAFVHLDEYFSENGINVPKIYSYTENYSLYLEQDLGDVSLFSRIHDEDTTSLVRATLSQLVRMQLLPRNQWQPLTAYKAFSTRQIFWDLNYFKYEFLKAAAIDFDEDALETDFCNFASALMSIPESRWGFMMRDCQSRNVMIYDDKPYFIDFQAGRYGPCLYDAISFLWQAKATFSADFRSEMLEMYAKEFAQARNINASDFLSDVPEIALFRTLQVLGAYGYRGLVQKRAHFIESIPGALDNLKALLQQGAVDSYPELKEICKRVVECDKFRKETGTGLCVKVFSFSYKKGYPEDYSGNGGGFMFDCRGMHNPGRYDEYKPLTGLDAPVIDFLKEKGEIDDFVAKALDIVEPTVRRYISRGFNSLQIGFGCTGGRHRSVYSAEAVANELAKRYPQIRMNLIHREQGIDRYIDKEG